MSVIEVTVDAPSVIEVIKGDALIGPPGPQGPQGPQGIEGPQGLQGPVGELAQSFVRAFGPDTATTIPANTWTKIPLDPAGEPWRQFGDQCWEPISVGDPDYAAYGGCMRCLQEGVYDFVGAVIFNSAQSQGDRGVDIQELRGPYAGQWDLVTSTPMLKVGNAALIVAGETYQYVGNIVILQAYSTFATSTTPNPRSEWLSVTRVGTGLKGDPGVQGPVGPPGLWTQITQAAYDALTPPDPNTLYVIVG